MRRKGMVNARFVIRLSSHMTEAEGRVLSLFWPLALGANWKHPTYGQEGHCLEYRGDLETLSQMRGAIRGYNQFVWMKEDPLSRAAIAYLSTKNIDPAATFQSLEQKVRNLLISVD